MLPRQLLAQSGAQAIGDRGRCRRSRFNWRDDRRHYQGTFGRLDILVNNAGVGGTTPFLETSLAEWNRIIGIQPDGRVPGGPDLRA